MRAPVFNTKPLTWQAAVARCKVFCDMHPDSFPVPADALTYLRYIFTDAEGLWCFRPSGKTGTTSTLAFLFHLTFGHPLTAVGRSAHSINADQVAYSLHKARVFSALPDCGTDLDLPSYLNQCLRLATVRHPFDRAVSGFSYLCRAHEMGGDQFLTERLRLSALTGFDWDRHTGTAEGFARYLDYLKQDLAHHATRPVDSHFRPQVLNILPDVFRPDLIGRCEDLPGFFAQIAERLDRPVPEGALEARALNVQKIPNRDQFDTPGLRQRVADVFAADYDQFNYSP